VQALLFLVFELAVVHQATDGRYRRGRDLDEIYVGLFGHSKRFGQADDADRFILNAGEANLGGGNFTVDTVRFISSYCRFLLKVQKRRRASAASRPDGIPVRPW
jgi:hypothetical protein